MVSGTNFRFTFRNGDGSLSQLVIYVPLGGLPAQSADPPVPKGFSGIGEIIELTDPSSYSEALNLIIASYP